MNDEVTSTVPPSRTDVSDGVEDLDDVGGMRRAGAVRALLGDRVRELAQRPAPVDAVERARHRHGLVGCRRRERARPSASKSCQLDMNSEPVSPWNSIPFCLLCWPT